METVKCTNCKGTGYVPSNSGTRRLVKCPICKGTGRKVINKKEPNKR